jgi:hypothetical protein
MEVKMSFQKGTDISPAAALARFEVVLETLRDYRVSEHWTLDEKSAARALAYFRDDAAGLPHDDTEYHAATDFLLENGQSIDWVCHGNLRPMISGAAGHSRRAQSIAKRMEA